LAFRIKGIDHILLAAPEGCEQAAKEFYSDILCMEEIEKPETLKKRGGVWFQFGGYQLHIGVETPFVPAKKAHPAFEVENIVELKEHLLTKGIEVIDDDARTDVKRFFVFDPFGNRLEFLEWVT